MKKKKVSKKVKVDVQTKTSLPKALVAGGAGFVGSHLCESLLLQGCVVFCVDNWITGKKENIQPFLKNPNFTFIEHDLNQTLPSLLPRFDYIFHLAGLSAYLNNQELNLETLLVNSQGTERLLELAVEHKAKFLLGSSCQVYSGVLSKKSLPEYFGSQASVTGVFSHHEAKRFAEALTTLFFKNKKVDARIVRLAYIYGPRMGMGTDSYMSRLFKNYKEEKSLVIPDEGLQAFYPTYISDVILGLVKAMFAQGTKGKIFNLINSEPTTFLNFAYSLRKLASKPLDIDFVAGEKVDLSISIDREIFQTQKELGWQPKISLEEGLKNTLDWLEGKPLDLKSREDKTAGQKSKTILKQSLKIKKPRVKKSRMDFKKHFSQLKNQLKRLKPKFFSRLIWIMIMVLTLTILLSTPIFLLGIHSYRGFKELSYLKQTFQEQNIEDLEEHGQKAETSLTRAQNLLSQFSWGAQVLGFSKGTRRLETLLTIGSDLAVLSQEAAQVITQASVFIDQSFQARPADYASMLANLRIDIKQINQKLDFLQVSVTAYPQLQEIEVFNIGKELQFLDQLLPQLRESVAQADLLIKLAPQFLAFNDKKTYLVIFQNNAELRPTGGFIGSFGFLSLEKGRLLDFTVEDVYSADGQLKGHVEPPPILKKYLGQASWYLRDANWSPDFPTAAKQIEWFLEKELSRKVDGVIAFNLKAAQLALEAVGPIKLPDYGEEITAQNLFEKAEYHAEIDFFPGSTQKKDFLGSLSTHLFERLINEQSKWFKVLSALKTGLDQKEILLSFHESSVQRTVNSFGWSGAIRDIQVVPNSLSHYLFIAEANVGVNKANYFLSREVDYHTVFLKQGETRQKITLTYRNRSPSQSWPAGDYKSYVRFYVPSETKLESLIVRNLTDSQKAADRPEVDESIEAGKKVFGFYLSVPVGEKREVTLNLTDPRQLSFDQGMGNYVLYLQKQSGTQADPLQITIDYPSYLRPAKVTPRAKVSAFQVIFQTEFETDKVFSIDFKR